MPGELPLDKILAPSQEIIPGGKGKELVSEKRFETLPVNPEKIPVRVPKSGTVRPVVSSPVSQDWRGKRAQEIDNVLAEGLNDIFLKMDSRQQADFKKAGEETVSKINVLLSETRVRVNKIIELIKKWLKMIPGVNKFFLEQEAKIKTDKIIKIKNKF